MSTFYKKYDMLHLLALFQLITYSSSQELWTGKRIKETLDDWRQQYPQLLRVSTAHETFHIPRSGGGNDCPYDEHVTGCENYFFTIQDFVTHPEGSVSSSHLPEVFWSGALHGDERLGPTVVMETAAVLLAAAACEALPGVYPGLNEVSDAKDCREDLRANGVDDRQRKWLARLVSTRRIVVIPSANSLGFFNNTRNEGNVDPGRDFPVATMENDCMKSVASRTINELFRLHMFQMAISFHDGDGALRWSWRRYPASAPDISAQLQLGKVFIDNVTGKRKSSIYHEVESPNAIFQSETPIVSSVESNHKRENETQIGSFEDWAYAASWDNHIGSCVPKTHNGYNRSQTIYNDSTNRALAIQASIDTQADVVKSVQGNIRLAIASADLVQPYVSVFAVNNATFLDDIIPLTKFSSKSCALLKAIAAPIGLEKVTIEWTVGGAIEIDFTDILYMKQDPAKIENELDCLMQPTHVGDYLHAQTIGKASGRGHYHENGPTPATHSSILGPTFKAEISTKDFQVGDAIVVFARARVDQSWKGKDAHAFLRPESHIVKARTDKNWKHEHAGKIIEGRTEWYSVPVTVLLEDYPPTLGSFQIYNRFKNEGEKTKTPTTPTPTPNDTAIVAEAKAFSMKKLLWHFLITLSSTFVVGIIFLRRSKRRSEKNKIQSVLHAEGFSDEPPQDPSWMVPEEEIIDFEDTAMYKGRRFRAQANYEDTFELDCKVNEELETIKII